MKRPKASSAPKKAKAITTQCGEDDERGQDICLIRPIGLICGTFARRARSRPRRSNSRHRNRAALRRLPKPLGGRFAFGNGATDARHRARAASKQAPVTPQVRSELLRDNIGQPDLEDTSPRAQLLRERARLRSELTDLDFDFQSGKLSESDYSGLKREIETKAAGVIQQLNTLPAKPVVKPRPDAQS